MRFNTHLPIDIQNLLENQYKEYIKNTSMTKKERRILREWVKDGHSVYENPFDIWADWQVPVEFLTVYRNEEYVKQHTKGMNSEDATRFALAYFGFDNSETFYDSIAENASFIYRESDIDEDIPF